MAYETQCGGCTSYDFQGDHVKGYCSYYRSYYYPGDSCSHQTPRESSGGCYITTVMCQVLGYTDHCFVLETLRNFRNHVMQKDSIYKDELLEYDVIGPIIASCIEKDYQENQDKHIWAQCYKMYLSKIADLTIAKNYSVAVHSYKMMIHFLKQYFGIQDIDLSEFRKNYDHQNGGHGIVKKLSIN